MFKKNLPNFITLLRIILTICLLFIKPFTAMFFIIYSASGATDILDGVIARATKTTSEFGAKLDSVADLLFYSVMIIKIFPTLLKILPSWLWVAAWAVVAIRVFCYVFAAIKYHCFASLHTNLNKTTGFFMFAMPYFVNLSIGLYYCISACIVAAASSIEELIIHIREPEYKANKKSA